MKAIRFAPQTRWVKAPSGNTYLCLVGTVTNPESASEAELKKHCVVESDNPQNN